MAALRGLQLVRELAQADNHGLAAAAVSHSLAAAAASLAVPAVGMLLFPDSFTAKAFSSLDVSGTVSACPAGFTSAPINKVYVFKLRTISSAFAPFSLATIYVKNFALEFLRRFQWYMTQTIEAEEKMMETGEEQPLPHFPDVRPMFLRSAWSALRELSTIVVRRVYEHGAAARLSARWAWKLLKEFPASLARKAEFYPSLPAALLFVMYNRTVLRCTALQYAADCTVSVVYEIVAALRGRRRAEYWVRAVGGQVLRCAVTWVGASAGAALVALVLKPPRGATWGHFAADLVVGNIMCVFIDNVLMV